MGDTGYSAFGRFSPTPLTLTNGFEGPDLPAVGTDGGVPAYWVDGTGICHLFGYVQRTAGIGGGMQTVIFASDLPSPAAAFPGITASIVVRALGPIDDLNPPYSGAVTVVGNFLRLHITTDTQTALPTEFGFNLDGISYPVN